MDEDKEESLQEELSDEEVERRIGVMASIYARKVFSGSHPTALIALVLLHNRYPEEVERNVRRVISLDPESPGALLIRKHVLMEGVELEDESGGNTDD